MMIIIIMSRKTMLTTNYSLCISYVPYTVLGV